MTDYCIMLALLGRLIIFVTSGYNVMGAYTEVCSGCMRLISLWVQVAGMSDLLVKGFALA
jgi:hypothetical protein